MAQEASSTTRGTATWPSREAGALRRKSPVSRGCPGWSSRSEASRLIGEGEVLVSGAVALSSSRLVGAAEPVVVRNASRWVGRGAEKLERALTVFEVDVANRHVLDAGASTGGFTDCLLQRGAAAVLAVDVGRHQLHEKLRGDPRVVSREGTDIRSLRPSDLPFPCSLIVADLSFISLTKVLPSLLGCASPEPGHPVPGRRRGGLPDHTDGDLPFPDRRRT